VELAGVRMHIVHERPHAQPSPGTQIVVFGHSHRTLVERRALDGEPVLYINPGAAGRAGFHRLQTVALLRITDRDVTAEIVELGARQAIARRSARRA
jgi:predicted phosphodiesterase